MYNSKSEFRPITAPQFVADVLNIYESEEPGSSASQAMENEKISQYFKIFPEESWIIRSIKLLLDEYP